MVKIFNKGYFSLFFLFVSYILQAQNSVTFSGRVTSETGEPLFGATVLNAAKVTEGTSTDENGNYTLNLPPGSYEFRYSYVGYLSQSIKIDLKANTVKNIQLKPEEKQIEEVVIQGEAPDKNVKSVEMSKVQISGKTIKALPVIFGETDVLKTITLLPGIKSGGEGSTGFYVRGGGPDQNLVLLDGAVVYNASHLLGFFSIFNGDIVEDVEVIKGGMPANYGGRLSSIVSVNMREGNREKLKVSGGVGIISSRLSVEGPIQKGRSSFIVSGRRTYADVLARPFLADSIRGNRLFFYDLNGKASFNLSKKDKLYLIGYYGHDIFRFENRKLNKFSFQVGWGNSIAGARWSRIYNNKLSSNISLIYNDFSLKSEASFLNSTFSVFSGLRDVTAKADFLHLTDKKTEIRYGGLYIYHTFIPGVLSAKQDNTTLDAQINRQYAHEGAAYISVNRDINTRLSINAGLRYSVFSQVGPYKQQIFDELGAPTDNYITYGRGQAIKTWGGAEPRFSFRYTLNATTSIKGSYTRTLQYLHLATSSSATLPTDLWVPSSRLIKPQIANQGALGLFKNFKDNEYETSVEAYYKPMMNQIEFKPGAQLFFNQNLENEMVFGKGLSYGVEFLVKKTKGKTTGWIGYTWSKTTRSFAIFNNGNPYYYRYDRRHDISVVVSHEISKKWQVNFVFVYGTGNALTLPEQRFTYRYGFDPIKMMPVFSIIDRYIDIANYRMPAYHRADVSFNYTPKPEKKKFVSSWNFSIYNIYNRANPYFIYFDPDVNTGKVTARMVYLFPILPSVTWNFKF